VWAIAFEFFEKKQRRQQDKNQKKKEKEKTKSSFIRGNPRNMIIFID
jgi:hypothetical protein